MNEKNKMKNILWIFGFLCLAVACGEDTTVSEQKQETGFPLKEVKNGMYKEYYPGTDKVRIQGELTEDSLRNGRWSFFDESGREASYTFFKEGKKHGFSYNTYANGAPFYYGEYWEDTMIGVWKTYDTDGKLKTKDYGIPKGY